MKEHSLSQKTTADPRGSTPSLTRKATNRGRGRNTESFDPTSTLVRPDLRIRVGSNSKKTYGKPLKHDDVVIVPELFGDEDDWSLYEALLKEMTDLQESHVSGSEWLSWHEGSHLIVKNPKHSETFNKLIGRLCEYFDIEQKSIGTRFNWYTNSADWKPFHHDSAAFNPDRAKTQNITVGLSLGATRELAFLRATEGQDSKSACRVKRTTVPSRLDGMLIFIGSMVLMRWLRKSRMVRGVLVSFCGGWPRMWSKKRVPLPCSAPMARGCTLQSIRRIRIAVARNGVEGELEVEEEVQVAEEVQEAEDEVDAVKLAKRIAKRTRLLDAATMA